MKARVLAVAGLLLAPAYFLWAAPQPSPSPSPSPAADRSLEVPVGMKPVWETRTKTVSYTVTKPVWESRTKVVDYTVMQPKWETKAVVTLDENGELPTDATPERTYRVCRMEPEQRSRTVEYKVCRMVNEQRQKEIAYNVVRFEPVE